MYTELLRKKSAMEEQLKEISEYLNMMKVSMLALILDRQEIAFILLL